MADLLEFLGYAATGLVAALGVFFAPRQTRAARRLALVLLGLAAVYPLGVLWLCATRSMYGESYGWIILGIGLGYLLAAIAGALLVAWVVLFVVGSKKHDRDLGEATKGDD
jgi:uncharacterized membrane protein